MAKITEKHIEDVYLKFKEYFNKKKDVFLEQKHKHIIDAIKEKINIENKYEWNDVSLIDYINNLIVMVKGGTFKRTINSFAKKYFIENICKDFGNEICSNAKESLKSHENYYNEVIKKNEDISPSTLESKLPIGDYARFLIKNIILYGSPGVGKTYSHKKLIALIESNDFKENKIFDFIVNNNEIEDGSIEELFKKVKQEQRMKFITFHQSFGYEDFIEGFRPNEDGAIELVDGIFKNICITAQKNLEDSTKEKGLDIENLVNDFVRYVEEQENFEIDDDLTIEVNKKSNGELQSFVTKGRVKDQSLTRDIIIRDLQDYFDGKITHYRDIKPTYESKSTYHGNAPYYHKLYAKIKHFLTSRSQYEIKKVEQKNYYLVIDEINRGNISRIFGELITLIEEDKRDTLEVTLPYSKKPFKIPSNFYIIGTMNSTDKSIALIDIALRRRFTFLKMKPKATLVTNPKAKKIFNNLNERITQDLGEDYQIGHSYFMKIQDDDDLAFVLDYKIIPLLEEYYYGDENRLQEIKKLCDLGES